MTETMWKKVDEITLMAVVTALGVKTARAIEGANGEQWLVWQDSEPVAVSWRRPEYWAHGDKGMHFVEARTLDLARQRAGFAFRDSWLNARYSAAPESLTGFEPESLTEATEAATTQRHGPNMPKPWERAA